MGVWPRKRAKRQFARVRNLPHSNDIKLLEFPAYKAGMTHVMATGQIKGQREAGVDSGIYGICKNVLCDFKKEAFVKRALAFWDLVLGSWDL